MTPAAQTYLEWALVVLVTMLSVALFGGLVLLLSGMALGLRDMWKQRDK